MFRYFTKIPPRVNLIYTVIKEVGLWWWWWGGDLCRTADLTHPMIKQHIHRDRPVFWRPSYPREGTAFFFFSWSCRLLSLLTQGSSSSSIGELPKRERYVPQVRVSDLKIPTTDLPFPSYSRHTSPWQCDTWLRTPRPPTSACPVLTSLTAGIGFCTCLPELKKCAPVSHL